jgi:hypothetical protein
MKKILFVLFCLACMSANAQNVGIGIAEPLNKLQVQGSLLVTVPTVATNTAPTAAQEKTIVNATTILFGSADSTGRIYDPGGPAGNYLPNLSGFVTISSAAGCVGIELSVETMQLGTGDSLIIREISGGSVVFMAVGNGYSTTGKRVFNTSRLHLSFKSNADANTGSGFSLLFKRLYDNSASLPEVSGATGKALFFDAKTGVFRSGWIGDSAAGAYSAAMGFNTNAVGDYSIAAGIGTSARGENSVAMGTTATAIGYTSLSLGRLTTATGDYAIAIGNNTSAGGFVSTAIGSSTNASGDYATALGRSATAAGLQSTAMGYNTDATGNTATAIGYNTAAGGDYATAMGYLSNAGGNTATATGRYTIASGFAATATGDSTRASGLMAFAAGFRSAATGIYATAIGNETNASGNSSTALGWKTDAGGNSSTALGNFTTASGNNSIAMGSSTTASGRNSTAMGDNTLASGNESTAMGFFTTASGDRSTAMGSYVSANNQVGALIIGDYSTSTILNSALPNSFRARFDGGYRFYTSAAATTAESCLLAAGSNAWSTTSDRTLKENFEPVNGESFLQKIAVMPLGSWNYKKQNPQIFRHYGPMAQDFFAAFGKDKYGTIGNDTTINSADFDGVNLIAIQALEKRTATQQENIRKLEKENAELRARLEKLEALILKQ